MASAVALLRLLPPFQYTFAVLLLLAVRYQPAPIPSDGLNLTKKPFVEPLLSSPSAGIELILTVCSIVKSPA